MLKDKNILQNVYTMGVYLETLLGEWLGNHPNIGDIHGRGLFWAIEFMANKRMKVPLDPALQVANKLHDRGMKKGYDISTFQATGSAGDRWDGDHILLAPPFIVQKSDMEEIADCVGRVVEDKFGEFALLEFNRMVDGVSDGVVDGVEKLVVKEVNGVVNGKANGMANVLLFTVQTHIQ